MYFAAQSMGAEFSTAVLLVQEIERSKADVALIIVGMEAEFIGRARSRTHFHCEPGDSIRECLKRVIESEEAQQVELKSEGFDSEGQNVSSFSFTWSLKLRA